jgi:hypothetical protein
MTMPTPDVIQKRIRITIVMLWNLSWLLVLSYFAYNYFTKPNATLELNSWSLTEPDLLLPGKWKSLHVQLKFPLDVLGWKTGSRRIGYRWERTANLNEFELIRPGKKSLLASQVRGILLGKETITHDANYHNQIHVKFSKDYENIYNRSVDLELIWRLDGNENVKSVENYQIKFRNYNILTLRDKKPN